MKRCWSGMKFGWKDVLLGNKVELAAVYIISLLNIDNVIFSDNGFSRLTIWVLN